MTDADPFNTPKVSPEHDEPINTIYNTEVVNGEVGQNQKIQAFDLEPRHSHLGFSPDFCAPQSVAPCMIQEQPCFLSPEEMDAGSDNKEHDLNLSVTQFPVGQPPVEKMDTTNSDEREQNNCVFQPPDTSVPCADQQPVISLLDSLSTQTSGTMNTIEKKEQITNGSAEAEVKLLNNDNSEASKPMSLYAAQTLHSPTLAEVKNQTHVENLNVSIHNEVVHSFDSSTARPLYLSATCNRENGETMVTSTVQHCQSSDLSVTQPQEAQSLNSSTVAQPLSVVTQTKPLLATHPPDSFETQMSCLPAVKTQGISMDIPEIFSETQLPDEPASQLQVSLIKQLSNFSTSQQSHTQHFPSSLLTQSLARILHLAQLNYSSTTQLQVETMNNIGNEMTKQILNSHVDQEIHLHPTQQPNSVTIVKDGSYAVNEPDLHSETQSPDLNVARQHDSRVTQMVSDKMDTTCDDKEEEEPIHMSANQVHVPPLTQEHDSNETMDSAAKQPFDSNATLELVGNLNSSSDNERKENFNEKSKSEPHDAVSPRIHTDVENIGLKKVEDEKQTDHPAVDSDSNLDAAMPADSETKQTDQMPTEKMDISCDDKEVSIYKSNTQVDVPPLTQEHDSNETMDSAAKQPFDSNATLELVGNLNSSSDNERKENFNEKSKSEPHDAVSPRIHTDVENIGLKKVEDEKQTDHLAVDSDSNLDAAMPADSETKQTDQMPTEKMDISCDDKEVSIHKSKTQVDVPPLTQEHDSNETKDSAAKQPPDSNATLELVGNLNSSSDNERKENFNKKSKDETHDVMSPTIHTDVENIGIIKVEDEKQTDHSAIDSDSNLTAAVPVDSETKQHDQMSVEKMDISCDDNDEVSIHKSNTQVDVPPLTQEYDSNETKDSAAKQPPDSNATLELVGNLNSSSDNERKENFNKKSKDETHDVMSPTIHTDVENIGLKTVEDEKQTDHPAVDSDSNLDAAMPADSETKQHDQMPTEKMDISCDDKEVSIHKSKTQVDVPPLTQEHDSNETKDSAAKQPPDSNTTLELVGNLKSSSDNERKENFNEKSKDEQHDAMSPTIHTDVENIGIIKVEDEKQTDHSAIDSDSNLTVAIPADSETKQHDQMSVEKMDISCDDNDEVSIHKSATQVGVPLLTQEHDSNETKDSTAKQPPDSNATLEFAGNLNSSSDNERKENFNEKSKAETHDAMSPTIHTDVENIGINKVEDEKQTDHPAIDSDSNLAAAMLVDSETKQHDNMSVEKMDIGCDDNDEVFIHKSATQVDVPPLTQEHDSNETKDTAVNQPPDSNATLEFVGNLNSSSGNQKIESCDEKSKEEPHDAMSPTIHTDVENIGIKKVEDEKQTDHPAIDSDSNLTVAIQAYSETKQHDQMSVEKMDISCDDNDEVSIHKSATQVDVPLLTQEHDSNETMDSAAKQPLDSNATLEFVGNLNSSNDNEKKENFNEKSKDEPHDAMSPTIHTDVENIGINKVEDEKQTDHPAVDSDSNLNAAMPADSETKQTDQMPTEKMDISCDDNDVVSIHNSATQVDVPPLTQEHDSNKTMDSAAKQPLDSNATLEFVGNLNSSNDNEKKENFNEKSKDEPHDAMSPTIHTDVENIGINKVEDEKQTDHPAIDSDSNLAAAMPVDSETKQHDNMFFEKMDIGCDDNDEVSIHKSATQVDVPPLTQEHDSNETKDTAVNQPPDSNATLEFVGNLNSSSGNQKIESCDEKSKEEPHDAMSPTIHTDVENIGIKKVEDEKQTDHPAIDSDSNLTVAIQAYSETKQHDQMSVEKMDISCDDNDEVSIHKSATQVDVPLLTQEHDSNETMDSAAKQPLDSNATLEFVGNLNSSNDNEKKENFNEKSKDEPHDAMSPTIHTDVENIGINKVEDEKQTDHPAIDSDSNLTVAIQAYSETKQHDQMSVEKMDISCDDNDEVSIHKSATQVDVPLLTQEHDSNETMDSAAKQPLDSNATLEFVGNLNSSNDNEKKENFNEKSKDEPHDAMSPTIHTDVENIGINKVEDEKQTDHPAIDSDSNLAAAMPVDSETKQHVNMSVEKMDIGCDDNDEVSIHKSATQVDVPLLTQEHDSNETKDSAAKQPPDSNATLELVGNLNSSSGNQKIESFDEKSKDEPHDAMSPTIHTDVENIGIKKVEDEKQTDHPAIDSDSNLTVAIPADSETKQHDQMSVEKIDISCDDNDVASIHNSATQVDVPPLTEEHDSNETKDSAAKQPPDSNATLEFAGNLNSSSDNERKENFNEKSKAETHDAMSPTIHTDVENIGINKVEDEKQTDHPAIDSDSNLAATMPVDSETKQHDNMSVEKMDIACDDNDEVFIHKSATQVDVPPLTQEHDSNETKDTAVNQPPDSNATLEFVGNLNSSSGNQKIESFNEKSKDEPHDAMSPTIHTDVENIGIKKIEDEKQTDHPAIDSDSNLTAAIPADSETKQHDQMSVEKMDISCDDNDEVSIHKSATQVDVPLLTHEHDSNETKDSAAKQPPDSNATLEFVGNLNSSSGNQKIESFNEKSKDEPHDAMSPTIHTDVENIGIKKVEDEKQTDHFAIDSDSNLAAAMPVDSETKQHDKMSVEKMDIGCDDNDEVFIHKSATQVDVPPLTQEHDSNETKGTAVNQPPDSNATLEFVGNLNSSSGNQKIESFNEKSKDEPHDAMSPTIHTDVENIGIKKVEDEKQTDHFAIDSDSNLAAAMPSDSETKQYDQMSTEKMDLSCDDKEVSIHMSATQVDVPPLTQEHDSNETKDSAAKQPPDSNGTLEFVGNLNSSSGNQRIQIFNEKSKAETHDAMSPTIHTDVENIGINKFENEKQIHHSAIDSELKLLTAQSADICVIEQSDAISAPQSYSLEAESNLSETVDKIDLTNGKEEKPILNMSVILPLDTPAAHSTQSPDLYVTKLSDPVLSLDTCMNQESDSCTTLQPQSLEKVSKRDDGEKFTAKQCVVQTLDTSATQGSLFSMALQSSLSTGMSTNSSATSPSSPIAQKSDSSASHSSSDPQTNSCAITPINLDVNQSNISSTKSKDKEKYEFDSDEEERIFKRCDELTLLYGINLPLEDINTSDEDEWLRDDSPYTSFVDNYKYSPSLLEFSSPSSEPTRSSDTQPSVSFASNPSVPKQCVSSASKPCVSFASEQSVLSASERTVSCASRPSVSFASEPSASFASNPSVPFASEPSISFASKQSVSFASEPSDSFASKPSVSFISKPSVSFASKQSVSFASEPSVSFASKPSVSFASEPSVSLASKPSVPFASEPSYSFASKPSVSFASEPSVSFASEPSASFASNPSVSFASEPSYSFASKPSVSFASEPSVSFASEPSASFASNPSVSFACEPSVSFPCKPSGSTVVSIPAKRKNTNGGDEDDGDDDSEDNDPETIKRKLSKGLLDIITKYSLTTDDIISMLKDHSFNYNSKLDIPPRKRPRKED